MAFFHRGIIAQVIQCDVPSEPRPSRVEDRNEPQVGLPSLMVGILRIPPGIGIAVPDVDSLPTLVDPKVRPSNRFHSPQDGEEFQRLLP